MQSVISSSGRSDARRDREETKTRSRTFAYGNSRPLLPDIIKQTQAIRLYYQFYNVDTVHVQAGYHQVMLSAQKLSKSANVSAIIYNLRTARGHEFRLEDRRGRVSAIHS